MFFLRFEFLGVSLSYHPFVVFFVGWFFMCLAAWWLQCAVVFLMYSGGRRTVDPLGNFWKGQVVLLCYSCKEYVIKPWMTIPKMIPRDVWKRVQSLTSLLIGVWKHELYDSYVCVLQACATSQYCSEDCNLRIQKETVTTSSDFKLVGKALPHCPQFKMNWIITVTVSFLLPVFFFGCLASKKPATRPPPVWGHEVSDLSCLPLQLPHLRWRRSRFRCVGA